jgi:ABC-type multidrug transport system fused ATPase/permease subunit
VNLQIKRGKLVAVVGHVGSGKSSLLNGLLGELILKEGSVRVHGSVAYCDQRAWILNATIKDNILFGLPYEKERFERA